MRVEDEKLVRHDGCGTEAGSSAAATAATSAFCVALAGNPNTGKTALFNALTGLRHKVANYPGVTVEKRWGAAAIGTARCEVVDLPGIYSLDSSSIDERIARDVLCGRQAGARRPDVAVVLLDPFHLERSLYVALQVMELGLPTVLAVNFMDEVRRKRLRIDLERLGQRLPCPVVPISALTREGIDRLTATIQQAMGVGQRFVASWPWCDPSTRAITSDRQPSLRVVPSEGHDPSSSGFGQVLSPSKEGRGESRDDGGNDACATAQQRYAWIGKQLDGVLVYEPHHSDLRAVFDRILLHPVGGPLIFLSIMVLVFQSIFTWALVPMGWIAGVVDACQALVHRWLGSGLPASFLADGVIAGVGSVVLFLPQIVILFFFIGILEDTGYLARGAFLLDRLMHKVGLNGKAFLPLFSSFACAIPGIMATRTIENRRERLITILVAPFMTCSARLPVYALITAALIPSVTVLGALNLQGLVFVSLYLLGIMAAAVISVVLKKVLRSGEPSHFFLELPPYRMPQWRGLLTTLWTRARFFLQTAGSIILLLSIGVWCITAFPRPASVREAFAQERQQVTEQAGDDAARAEAVAGIERRESAALLEASAAGRLGRWLEPAIRPLGFDWKIGVAIIASFAQREVFVSTLSIINSLGSGSDGATALEDTLRSARHPVTQQPLYPPAVGLSILVFYAFACQCVSTLAVVRRETGSWRWPAVMFAYMTVLAYVSSLIVYQSGRLLGWA